MKMRRLLAVAVAIGSSLRPRSKHPKLRMIAVLTATGLMATAPACVPGPASAGATRIQHYHVTVDKACPHGGKLRFLGTFAKDTKTGARQALGVSVWNLGRSNCKMSRVNFTAWKGMPFGTGSHDSWSGGHIEPAQPYVTLEFAPAERVWGTRGQVVILADVDVLGYASVYLRS